jgi:hypothetical protein
MMNPRKALVLARGKKDRRKVLAFAGKRQSKDFA